MPAQGLRTEGADMTDNELAILTSQRLPGFGVIRDIAAELLEARRRIWILETELAEAKAAATYGATMVKEMRDAL
jgi:hypothetical protein